MTYLSIILKDNSYKIQFGVNLIEDQLSFKSIKFKDKVMLITDENLSIFWKNRLIRNLSSLEIKVHEYVISSGEKYKTINTAELIISKLIEYRFTRNSILIALGGGVIGDLTGFIASIYQRGIRYLQIPTTLLAQVDASIGGKTAVNHILAKNIVGSFWQPELVLIDINFLSTLPIKQLISGMAEIVKYAILYDLEFFRWLEINYEKILQLDKEAMLYCIKKCCQIKASIIMKDEKETKKIRVLLNLGHTYGHAIESFTNYTQWLHGEAVSVGLIMAAKTSELLGILSSHDFVRILNLLQRIGLPIKGPVNMDFESYLEYMKRDKKNTVEKSLKLILPISIGSAQIFDDISDVIIHEAIRKCT